MDLILRNARRIGAEHELTDIGIAGERVAAIEPGLAAEGETIDLGRAHKREMASRIFDQVMKLRLALHAAR